MKVPVSGSPAIRSVVELPASGYPDRRVHPEWADRFPWLTQGITTRGNGEREADFALFTSSGGADPALRLSATALWVSLARVSGFRRMIYSRQVHGAGIRVHRQARSQGLEVDGEFDGHAAGPGILMGITIADCVPAFLVDSRNRVTALLHAGWRGTEKGILEKGLAVLQEAFGTAPEDVFLHLGPAICGSCYEVGPEVHRSLGLPDPGSPTPVDLRAVLSGQAMAKGVSSERITRSSFCTRCGDSPFFSHRNGHCQRQVAFLGVQS